MTLTAADVPSIRGQFWSALHTGALLLGHTLLLAIMGGTMTALLQYASFRQPTAAEVEQAAIFGFSAFLILGFYFYVYRFAAMKNNE